MSNNDKKKKEFNPHANWDHLKQHKPDPKGPPKPWDAGMEEAGDEFVEFLKNSEGKKALHEFLMETFKRFEAEKLSQAKARYENERKVDSQKMEEFHSPGNIAPIMAETFNMFDSEKAFARGLTATKKNLVRSLEDRVEEINNLLAGLGGFSSQLKSCFARSTVVFLEQEDPKHSFRERLIFSVNLPSYELKRNWAKSVEATEKKKFIAKKKPEVADGEFEDPRTPLVATWDDAVNSLAQIIAATGLKPKYVKNDRHYGRFVMKQDLRSTAYLPDEYFSLTLDYNSQDKIKEMCQPYNVVVKDYEKKIKKLEKKLAGYATDSVSPRYALLKKKYINMVQERDYFVGTTPDPNQLDEGLLFLIEVSTLKDYHIVKDRMQSIMTKYILHLSKIAMQDAKVDPDLEYEVWRQGRNNGTADGEEPEAKEPEFTVADLASVPEYVIDEAALHSVGEQDGAVTKKKKAA